MTSTVRPSSGSAHSLPWLWRGWLVTPPHGAAAGGPRSGAVGAVTLPTPRLAERATFAGAAAADSHPRILDALRLAMGLVDCLGLARPMRFAPPLPPVRLVWKAAWPAAVACRALMAGSRGPGPVVLAVLFTAWVAALITLLPLRDLAGQREALARAGCAVIREETASGSSMAARGELRTVLDFVGAGDELVVIRVDRLARSIGDLQDVVRELRAKGASLRCTEQPVDTSTAAGKAFLDMLGVFAEFETALRRERQMEGIARAKAAGKYKGRKPAMDPARVRALHAEGVRPSEIARRLQVGRTTVWRALQTERAAARTDQTS